MECVGSRGPHRSPRNTRVFAVQASARVRRRRSPPLTPRINAFPGKHEGPSGLATRRGKNSGGGGNGGKGGGNYKTCSI